LVPPILTRGDLFDVHLFTMRSVKQYDCICVLILLVTKS
jgi:hypothetical protein